MLLSSAYFPPIEYFALLARDITLSPDRVIPSCAVLEACEHYSKQTWRNRCRILTATGPDILQVPVIHDAPKIPVMEVRIEYTTPWVIRTERAIDSAYRTSAYFEYYRDELFANAGRFIIDKKKASIGNLPRMFKIGFNRAARIMDQLSEAGVVGEEQGTKPREILMTAEQFEELLRQTQ